MSLIDTIKEVLNLNKKNAQIYATTLQKTYGEKEPLEIGLYENKTPIANTEITININNKTYTRTTNTNGIATLNINLPQGTYRAYITFETETYNKIKTYTDVIIKPKPITTRIEGIDLTMNEGDGSKYQCAVYDENNNRLNCTVDITINNKTYNRTTDNTGLAYLNINLPQGTYPIKATYQGNNTYKPSNTNNTITIKPKPVVTQKPKEKTYSEQILEYFESKFGKVTCIDDCLEKVQNKGYGYYYDDKLTNKQTIDGLATRGGTKPNCTDIHHVFWHLGKALGYDVRAIHVKCQSGTGHVRLDFNRGNGWFSRDASAVADGNGITHIWCANGTKLATNPAWFMGNLNR